MGTMHDIETTTKIKIALMSNPHVGGLEISVHTVNGIVFLGGVVQDVEKKVLAERIASSHGGIDIKNDITVLGNADEEELPTGEVQESDDAIRNRIIGDMESDGRVNVSMINVEVSNGVVHLSGIQDNEAGRARAQAIAYQVHGVHGVVNDIEIRRAA